jgi:hypothetical protein
LSVSPRAKTSMRVSLQLVMQGPDEKPSTSVGSGLYPLQVV